MPWSFVADRADDWIRAAGTTFDIAVPATIAVGQVLIVEAVADNTGTTSINSGGTELSMADDAGGNTYTKLIEGRKSSGAATDGITTALFYCVLATQLTTAHTWRLTLATSRQAKAFKVRQFSTGGDTVGSTSATGATGTSASPTVTHNPGAAGTRLWVGLVGRERPTEEGITQDADFTTVADGFAGTTGSTPLTNVSGVSAYQIESVKTTENYAPTIATSADYVALLASLDLTVSGTTITPGTGALTLTGNAPTVNSGSVTITPGTGSLTLTGNAPTVVAPVLKTPSTGTLTLTGNAPTLAFPVVLTPETGALTLTGQASTLGVSSPVITPGTGTLTLTGLAGLALTLAKRYANADVYISDVLYAGRVMEAPSVTEHLSDGTFGTVVKSEVEIMLANGDGALNILYGSIQGESLSYMIRDETDTVIQVWIGIVDSTAIGDGVLIVRGISLATAIFEENVPRNLIDTTWPTGHDDGTGTGRVEDVGNVIPYVIGNMPKVRCPYINEDLAGAKFDYMVCQGAKSVAAMYRGLGSNQVTLITASEYTASTTRYPGYTTVRFTIQQIDSSGGLATIYADVAVPADQIIERNPARTIRMLLEEVNQTVDTAAFDQAESDADELGLEVDFALQEQEPLQDVLQRLMELRDMALYPTAAGWALAVDRRQSVVKYAFVQNPGSTPNIMRLDLREEVSILDATKNMIIKYMPDPLDNGRQIFEASRLVSTNNYASDDVVQMPYIRTHRMADLTVDFRAKRRMARVETMRLTGPPEAMTRLNLRDLVSVTAPSRILSDAIFEILELSRDPTTATYRLTPWTPAPYVYEPGTLPTDLVAGTFQDFSRVAPAAITDLTFPSGATNRGTETSPVGTVTAFVTVRFTTPASNYNHAVVRYRKTVSTIWTAAGETFQTGTVDFMIRGLEVGTSYDYSVQAVNAWGLVAGG